MTSWQFQLLRLYFRLKRWFEPHPSTQDVQKRRDAYEVLTAKFTTNPLIRCTPDTIHGMAVEWIDPPGAQADRVILYLHGGAYCLCSINTHRSMTGHIAGAARARALLIDYRLAPEHPFPAALEDAVSAYHALLDMGMAPESIVIAGDSAGGGLALALLVSLRDAGEPLPAAAVCISPWTVLSLSGKSMTTNAKADVVLDYKTLKQSAEYYLNGADARTPLASPLFADLHDLPPLLIQAGTDEIILSDAMRVAEKARAAGVDVTLDVWARMQHEWQFAPEGRQAVERIGAFMQRYFSMT